MQITEAIGLFRKRTHVERISRTNHVVLENYEDIASEIEYHNNSRKKHLSRFMLNKYTRKNNFDLNLNNSKQIYLFMDLCPGTMTTHTESINSDLQRGLDTRLRHTQH